MIWLKKKQKKLEVSIEHIPHMEHLCYVTIHLYTDSATPRASHEHTMHCV